MTYESDDRNEPQARYTVFSIFISSAILQE